MSKFNALLQRLMGLLPFRRPPDSATDAAGPDADEASPAPGATAAEPELDTITEEALVLDDADPDIQTAIEGARKRLIWKKRIIVAVPTLLLVILIASIAAWLLESADETEQARDAESSLVTPADGGDTKTATDHAVAPLAPPVATPSDTTDRTRELEEQLRQMEQERNALLIEKNALSERNRKLQEAAARRAAQPTTLPRSRSSLPGSTDYSSEGDDAAGRYSSGATAPPPSVDCIISGDLETAGDLLKRCIEEFNAANEGR